MALVIKDRVKQTSTTTGTGTLTLNGTVDGFQTFAAALSDGDTTYYALLEPSTNEWEVGLGTWTEGSSLLARTTILASSNSGSAVSLTAQSEVFITQPAGKAAFFNADGDLALTRDPQSSLQAATKQYVDTIAAAGIHYHPPVRVEHPSNLTATYNNGTAGVGATLTNSGTQAALVLDSITMVSADRVLVANQTDQTQNGVYTVTNIGSGSTNWVLTRATDADSYAVSDGDALGEGDAFFIKEGNTNAGHLDVMTTSGTITFGTTNIVFSEVAETSIYSAGNGLTLIGTVFAADAGTGVTVDGSGINIGQAVETTSDVTFNSVAAALTGNVTGNVSGDVTGNADTATALATARTIAGNSFDGTANITIATADLSDADQAVATTDSPTFVQVTANLVGNVTGNVTGDVTGDVTGNADTATALAATVNIAGQPFDGTANISISASDLSDVNQSLATTDAVTFASVTADLTGDVTGNVTGDLTGNVTGNVAGNVTGNVDGQVILSEESQTGDGSTTLVVDPTKGLELLTSSSSAESATLANGSTVGQTITVLLEVDGGGDVTLTPATFLNGTTIAFADAGDSATMVWTGTNGWAVIGSQGSPTIA